MEYNYAKQLFSLWDLYNCNCNKHEFDLDDIKPFSEDDLEYFRSKVHAFASKIKDDFKNIRAETSYLLEFELNSPEVNKCIKLINEILRFEERIADFKIVNESVVENGKANIKIVLIPHYEFSCERETMHNYYYYSHVDISYYNNLNKVKDYKHNLANDRDTIITRKYDKISSNHEHNVEEIRKICEIMKQQMDRKKIIVDHYNMYLNEICEKDAINLVTSILDEMGITGYFVGYTAYISCDGSPYIYATVYPQL